MKSSFRQTLASIATASLLAVSTMASAAVISPADATFQAPNSVSAPQSLGATVTSDLYVWFDLTLAPGGAINNNDFVALQLRSAGNPSVDNVNIGFKGNSATNSDAALDYFVRTAFSNVVYGGANAVVGETAYLFGHVYKDAGAAGGASGHYNVFDLYVRDTAVFDLPGLFASAPDVQSIGDSGHSSFDSFAFRDANLDAGDAFQMNNIHIAYNVPEPGSLALLGLAAAAGLVVTSRRRVG